MQNVPDILGAVIKQARELKAMRAETLAEHLDISTRHLSAIENGVNKPGYKVLFKVIRLLDIPPEIIFFPENFGDVNEEIIRNQVLMAVRTCNRNTLNIIHAILSANASLDD